MARHELAMAGPPHNRDRRRYHLGEMGCAGLRQAEALGQRQIIRPKILLRRMSLVSSHHLKYCRVAAMQQMQCLLKEAQKRQGLAGLLPAML